MKFVSFNGMKKNAERDQNKAMTNFNFDPNHALGVMVNKYRRLYAEAISPELFPLGDAKILKTTVYLIVQPVLCRSGRARRKDRVFGRRQNDLLL